MQEWRNFKQADPAHAAELLRTYVTALCTADVGPGPKEITRQRGSKGNEKLADFQPGICPEVSHPCHSSHQTYANGNGNKLR